MVYFIYNINRAEWLNVNSLRILYVVFNQTNTGIIFIFCDRTNNRVSQWDIRLHSHIGLNRKGIRNIDKVVTKAL